MTTTTRLLRRCLIAAVLIVTLIVSKPHVQGQVPDNRRRLGLYVDNGVLKRHGTPFRAFGVNYFNAFYRTIKNPGDKSYRKGFAVLKKNNIPCIRFMASGFWPIDFKLYQENRKKYFMLLDEFIKEAEKQKLGLIPCVFWYYAAIPDLVGEPMDQWGNPDSKTIQFMRSYTREIITRYQNSPAIWAWEMGNEYSLHTDLPNASLHRPKVHPKLGTAMSRSKRDDLSSKHLMTAMTEFAKEARKHDKHRLLITGNAIPRAAAWHMTHKNNWTTDTRKQYEQVLLRDNPKAYDSLCIHYYPSLNSSASKYFADGQVNLNGLLIANMDIAKRAKKPLIVGEFGVSKTAGKPGQVKKYFVKMVQAIEKSGIPLALLWVFDHPGQNKEWNITEKNDRSYQLTMIGQANKRLK